MKNLVASRKQGRDHVGRSVVDQHARVTTLSGGPSRGRLESSPPRQS